MSTYDKRGQQPTYHETDEEVVEAAEAAIRYIHEGNTFDAPYDLRGLTVFGIIGALRVHDEQLHGAESTLSDKARQRLTEVEETVQTAVDKNMHYYPFGDSHTKTQLDSIDKSRLHGYKGGSVNKARTSRAQDRYTRRSLQERQSPDAD